MNISLSRSRIEQAALAAFEYGKKIEEVAPLQRFLVLLGDLLDERTSPLDLIEWKTKRARALTMLADLQDDNKQLGEAVQELRGVLRLAEENGDTESIAKAHLAFANALSNWGANNGSEAEFGESISHYASALELTSRAATPILWAEVQSNMAVARKRLAQALFTSGDVDGGASQLEQGVEGLRQALEVRTMELMPKEWVLSSMNLANALRLLGTKVDLTEYVEEATRILDNTYAVVQASPMKDRCSDDDIASVSLNYAVAALQLHDRTGGYDFLEKASEAVECAVAIWHHLDREVWVGKAIECGEKISQILHERDHAVGMK